MDPPTFTRKKPAAQLEQLMAPGVILTVPAGQLVHIAALPVGLKDPGAQLVQPVALKLFWYVPAAQFRMVNAPEIAVHENDAPPLIYPARDQETSLGSNPPQAYGAYEPGIKHAPTVAYELMGLT